LHRVLRLLSKIRVDYDGRLGLNGSEDNGDCVSVSVGLRQAVEGDDNPEADAVEEEVGDGDPVLGRGPVAPPDHPHVLDADAEHDDDPGPEQTAVSTPGPEYEEKSATNTDSSIHDGVLDNDAGA